MHAKHRTLKMTLYLAPLLLLGVGCPSASQQSYTSTQGSWSELTAEQRAQIRAVVRTFNDLEGKTPDEIRAIEPLRINVMTLGDGGILPFPEEQFELVTPVQCPDDCPEDHYVGSKGLTLDLRRLNEPPVSCEWGMASSSVEMDVEQDALARWLEEYLKQKR